MKLALVAKLKNPTKRDLENPMAHYFANVMCRIKLEEYKKTHPKEFNKV